MLILSRKKNQQILISGDIAITIIDIENDKVKLGIEAPKDIKVFRKELVDGVKISNMESSAVSMENFEKFKEKIFSEE
ncbi:MAG: carbon storage regulator CsrA [Clostridia bacterium]|nr:carbon storage regulator CsrA [Clostridia bacterium]